MLTSGTNEEDEEELGLGEWVMAVGWRTVGGVVGGYGLQRIGGFEQMRGELSVSSSEDVNTHSSLSSVAGKRGRESRFVSS